MKRVLVADDDIVMIRLCQLHLQRAGMDAIVFRDGNTVWKEAEQLEFDLAILDFMIPGKSGLELIEFFKQSDKLKEKPLIVITGQGKASVKEGLLEAGANEVFTKPFSPLLLVKKINELLSEQEVINS